MPATTRRNGNITTFSFKETTTKTDMPPSTRPNTRPKPTPYLLLVYPVLLALGSLYSTISPAASTSREAPLAPGLSSDLNTPVQPQAISYFAEKHNLLNLYFVKIGWFWTTLAFILVQLTSNPPTKRPNAPTSTSTYLQAAIRYGLVTGAWLLTTQWFFGPHLIDRSFTITGGKCDALPAEILAKGGDVDASDILTGLACKAIDGKWRGGHDISGHVFMLVLSSAFLAFELFISDQHSSHPSVSPSAAAAVAANTTPEEKRAVGGWESETAAKLRLWTRYFAWTVIGLDVWMLLMTAVWFHTFAEKMSGLLISGVCVWSVYFLPQLLPAWRGVVGGF